MSNESFIYQIIEFINELIASLDNGVLFFGSPWDFIRYVLDIIMVTFLFYWILLFIRQTRAWQLIKGIVLILFFVAFCGIIGLDMVGFIFNTFLYVFAILFIVLFQPELRRALETVGLRSSSLKFLDVLRHGEEDDRTRLTSFINEICTACGDMAKTYTGALILIERNTKLNELLTQENVVSLDSAVTSTMLTSIFYKGSPMHDGGLLIRDGRIVAARCHVPLSVTMHSLDRYGTRHRAAVGASEMGDTVVVVVSEERGTVSIAVNGRLFEMKDTRELEANLAYLLGLEGQESEQKGISKLLGKMRRKKVKVAESEEVTIASAEAENAAETMTIRTKTADKSNAQRVPTGTRVLFFLLSIFLSMTLWLYIQINNNPVVTKTMTVPINKDINVPQNVSVEFPINSVEIEIVGRKDTIDQIDVSDIIVAVDYSGVGSNTGVVNCPIVVSSAENDVYFRVDRQFPENEPVTIYPAT
ncbi:MAG: diadenylate cyclase [Saccharofermentans sp.]|nr:diadenylate cyclase [Saccharofermentans sp.]